MNGLVKWLWAFHFFGGSFCPVLDRFQVGVLSFLGGRRVALSLTLGSFAIALALVFAGRHWSQRGHWSFLVSTARVPEWPLSLQSPQLGRTPKGSYSPRGRSRHLLGTPFSEPLLRTLSEPFSTVKTIERPLFTTLLKPLLQNPSQNLLRTLLRTLCCRTTTP